MFHSMLYYGIMYFTVKKEVNHLIDIFKKDDYDCFKTEFTSKIPINTNVGNLTKKYLVKQT
jgi:hypothetical protein